MPLVRRLRLRRPGLRFRLLRRGLRTANGGFSSAAVYGHWLGGQRGLQHGGRLNGGLHGYRRHWGLHGYHLLQGHHLMVHACLPAWV